MTVTKQLIDNVEKIRTTLNEITVYNLDVKTSLELYYELARKVNEVINELSRFEGVVSDEVIKQNEKLIYLLGEGLKVQVGLKIDELITNGIMDSIINHKIFNDLNTKIVEFNESLTNEINNTNKSLTGEINTFKQEVNEQFNTKATKTFISFEDFGAVGDGVTDDTVAIQNALNSGFNLHSKNKTYLFSSKITLTNDNVCLNFNNATLKFKNGTSTTNVGNEGVFDIKANNVSINDLTINVNGNFILRPKNNEAGYHSYLDIREKTYQPICILNSSNINLNNVISTHGKVGFFIAHSRFITLSNCKSIETLADGVFVTGSSNQVSVIGHHCYRVQDDCYSADGFNADTSLNPSYVIFDCCTAVDCFGALTCLEGSTYTTCSNSKGSNHRYSPFKMGNLINGSVIAPGHTQRIINCDVTCNDIEYNFNYDIYMFLADATHRVSNLEIINCNVTKLDINQVECYFQYCDNCKIINSKFENFTPIIKNVNNLDVENCKFKTLDNSIVTSSSNVNILNSYFENKAKFEIRGKRGLTFTNCNDMKCLGCNIKSLNPSLTGSTFSIYNDSALNNYSIDIDFLAVNTREIDYNGVFVNKTNIDPINFKDGQQVYVPSENRVRTVINRVYI